MTSLIEKCNKKSRSSGLVMANARAFDIGEQYLQGVSRNVAKKKKEVLEARVCLRATLVP